jgi:hypothetical protein
MLGTAIIFIMAMTKRERNREEKKRNSQYNNEPARDREKEEIENF